MRKENFDNTLFDYYTGLLASGSPDDLIDLRKDLAVDTEYKSGLMEADRLIRFVKSLPAHLCEIFLDQIFLLDADIFNSQYKDMLNECSKSGNHTVAKKANSILQLYKAEFDKA